MSAVDALAARWGETLQARDAVDRLACYLELTGAPEAKRVRFMERALADEEKAIEAEWFTVFCDKMERRNG